MPSLADIIKRSQQEYSDISLGSNSNPYLYRINKDENIVDGDTIGGGRIKGVDAFESSAGISSNEKARRIAEEQGLSLEEQKRLGLAGKSELQKIIGSNEGMIFEKHGTDKFGRALLYNEALNEQLVETGNYVPTDRYDQKLQTLFRSAEDKIRRLDPKRADAMMAQREYNIERQNTGLLGSLGQVPSAFMSGGQQLLAGGADMIADALTKGNSTYFEKAKSAEEADAAWGYDRREQQFRTAEALHKWKQGDYAGAVATAGVVAPEVIAESMPMMATMFVPATGAVKVGSMFLGATKSAKIAGALNEAKVLKNVADVANKNAGFATVVGITTNNDIEEYTKNNNGVEPSIERIAGMTALNTLQLGIDKFVFKDVVSKYGSPNKFISTMKDALKILPDNAATDIAMIAARAVIAGGEEFAQEYAQTWAEILNQKLGTTKYGSFENIINNPELRDEALASGIMGAGTGGTMSLGASAVQGAPKGIDTFNTIVGSMRANTKLTPEQQRAVNLAGGDEAASGAGGSDSVGSGSEYFASVSQDYKDFDESIGSGNYDKAEEALFRARDKYMNAGLEEGSKDYNKATMELSDMIIKHREAVANKVDVSSPESSVTRLTKLMNEGVPLDSQELGSDRRAIGYAIDYGIDGGNAEQVAELAKALGFDKEKVDNYVVEQKALSELKRKSSSDVEKEITTGEKGYLTYFEKMKAAKAIGDTTKAEEYLGKLQHFLGTQTIKYNRLAEGIAEAENTGKQVEVDYSAKRGAEKFIVYPAKIASAKRLLDSIANTVKNIGSIIEVNGGAKEELTEYELKERIRSSASQPIKEKANVSGAKAPETKTSIQKKVGESKNDSEPKKEVVGSEAAEKDIAEKEMAESQENEYAKVEAGEKNKAEFESSRADNKWKRMIALKNEKLQALARKTKKTIAQDIVIDNTEKWNVGDVNSILEKVASRVGNKMVLNEDVAEAMSIAYISWIAQDAERTVALNKKEMARIIGVRGDITNEQVAMLEGKGVLQKNIVRSLGKLVLENLDIDIEATEDYKVKINLETALGNILFATMVNRGIIEQHEINAAEFNRVMKLKGENQRQLPVMMARFNPKGVESSSYIKAVKSVMKDVADLFLKDGKISGPNYENSGTQENHKIRKREDAKVSKQDEERLQAQEKIEHRVKGNVVQAFERLGEYGKYALGYVGESELNAMHKTKRGSVKASNSAIERYIDQMREHVAIAEDKSYTFNYFMSADGRDMIDSNTFNPQTIKAHRHIDYTGEEIELDPNEDSKEMLYFKMAVLQGLNEKVEKMNAEQVEAKFDELINDKTAKYVAAKLISSEPMNESTQRAVASYIGDKDRAQMHTLDAMVAFGEYMMARKEGRKFKTNLQLEVDAVTSGWILALLQSPAFDLQTTKDMLRKGGVYIDDMNADYANISGNKLEDDSYVTLQKVIESNIENMRLDSAFTNVLPIDRDFAKAPFMTHIVYGAGIEGTLNDIENQYIEKLYDMMAEGKIGEVNAALKSIGVVANINYGKNFIFKPEQESAIRAKVRDTYGKATKDAIGSKYSMFTQVRDLINKSFKEMFDGYDKAYKEGLAKLRAENEVVTVKDIKKLERSLVHLLPTIKSPNGTDVQIFSKEKLDSVIENELKVQTKFQKKYDGNRQSITTEGEMKRIAASATSGGVNPIHFIDGSVIGELLKQFQMTGIYDAGLFNLSDVESAVKLYNKTLIEKSENYNFLEEVLKAGNRLGISDDTRQGIIEALSIINANRKAIFSSDINAQHFAMNGIAFKREGSEPSVDATVEQDIETEIDNNTIYKEKQISYGNVFDSLPAYNELQSNMVYAGIGSRETPSDIQIKMAKIARYLEKLGYTLRSGGADGADIAFESGIKEGKKEIYIPWKGFNGSDSNLYTVDEKAISIAKEVHPAPDRLSLGALKLQARNTYQVFGENLDKPSDFIVAWTANGELKGGTAQALRMAQAKGIPIINLAVDGWEDKLNKAIKSAKDKKNNIETNELGISGRLMNRLDTMSASFGEQAMQDIMSILKEFKDCK